MVEEQKRKTAVTMSTKMAKKARDMVKAMNKRAHEANVAGEPVAYCFPAGAYDEIVRAMDIAPVWVENWGGVCGAKREANRFLSQAEAEGYSQNLCTYTTCCLGFDIMRYKLGNVPDAPDGGLPRPTVMLGQGSSICCPRTKLYQAVQRYMDVPMYVNNIRMLPPHDANIEEVRPYYIKYIVEELKGLVNFLERHTGRKMDWDRLSHHVKLSEETKRLWREIQQLQKAVPCPLPVEDILGTLVPVFFLLGTQEAVDFYRELYDEVKNRVEKRIGVIPEEKYRLLWGGGAPPWYALIIFNYVESLGAVFVAEATYVATRDTVEIPSSVTHPLERVAWGYFGEMTKRHEKAQKHTGSPAAELLWELINDCKIDGIVMNTAYSCRGLHAGLIHRLSILRQYSHLPSMDLQLDMVDMRTYNEEQTKNRLNEFIQVVDANKRGKSS